MDSNGLTLIQAAGGVYDFRNLNRNNLTSSKVTNIFKIHVFLKNVLGVYLVKYFKVKLAISVIFKSTSMGNCLFFHCFVHSGQLGGIFDSFDYLHHHPLPVHAPCQ
jgi:hypothetical protein